MNEILNLRDKSLKEERAKVFKIAMPILSVFCITQTLVNVFVSKGYDVPTLISHVEDISVLCATLWAYLTKYKKLNEIISTLLPIPLIGILLRIYLAGGVDKTDATLWIFIFPIAASYFVSYRYSYLISFLISLGVVAISAESYLQGKGFGDPSYILGVVANLWFITLTVCRYEKNKNKVLGIIDAESRERQVASSHYSTSQIVQGFAHEINNPLCIINLFIQQLEFENKISEDEKNQIESNILRITDLIMGLKERIAKHNPRLTAREVPMGQVMSNVLSCFSEECDKRNIVLKSHLALLDKITVPVIESEVFESLSYIFHNAIESAENSNERKISLFYYEDLGQIHINDSGPDFTSESKTLAFNTFYTTKSGHSGIGLSVAKELLRKNKLGINITDSSKGKVIISLPI